MYTKFIQSISEVFGGFLSLILAQTRIGMETPLGRLRNSCYITFTDRIWTWLTSKPPKKKEKLMNELQLLNS